MPRTGVHRVRVPSRVVRGVMTWRPSIQVVCISQRWEASPYLSCPSRGPTRCGRARAQRPPLNERGWLLELMPNVSSGAPIFPTMRLEKRRRECSACSAGASVSSPLSESGCERSVLARYTPWRSSMNQQEEMTVKLWGGIRFTCEWDT